MLDADCPALLAPLSFVLTTNPSDPYFAISSARCRRSPGQRGVLRRSRRTMRSSLPLQKPPFHHVSPLCSTTHHKRGSRRDPSSHRRGSRSASQVAVVAAEVEAAPDCARAICSLWPINAGWGKRGDPPRLASLLLPRRRFNPIPPPLPPSLSPAPHPFQIAPKWRAIPPNPT